MTLIGLRQSQRNMAKQPVKTVKKVAKVKRPTAQKREIQSEKRKILNRSFKASVRTAVRRFESALEKGDAEAAKLSLNDVYSVMDKGVKRGVFKVNKASRTKARLSARIVNAQ